MADIPEKKSITDTLLVGDSDDEENEKLENPSILPPKLSHDVDSKMYGKAKSQEDGVNARSVETKKIGQRVARIKKTDDTHTNIYNFTELHNMGDNVIDAYEEMDIDEILEFVGHEGKYQYTMVMLASIMSIIMSMIMYASSYLLAAPEFYQSINEGTKWQSLTEKNFCN